MIGTIGLLLLVNTVLIGVAEDIKLYVATISDSCSAMASECSLPVIPIMMRIIPMAEDGLMPTWKDMRNMDIHPKDAVSPEGMIMSGNVVRKNIIYYSDPDAKLLQLRTVPYDRNRFDENLYWHKGMSLRIPLKDVPEDKEWEEWQKMGQDQRSIVADPLFADAENGDYRLKSESPVFRLGFEKIPVDEIGPYKDELRASWPIVEAEGAREKPLLSE